MHAGELFAGECLSWRYAIALTPADLTKDDTRMPLPRPTERRTLHTRRIECVTYERRDGLWDVEANLIDVKTDNFDRTRGRSFAGEHLHNMWLRLTLDDTCTVRNVEAVMDAFPMEGCPGAELQMKKLIGLKIGGGWRAEVQRRIGGALGCTHLRELLGPMATTALQGINPELRKRDLGRKSKYQKGSCWAKSDDEDRAEFVEKMRARDAAKARAAELVQRERS
jgi:hypothetical protein